MTNDEYQVKAARSLASLKDVQSDNLHMVLGMVTESAELADVFKKNLAYGKEIDWINVREEVGDILWYIANFCTINNISMSNIMKTNIDKLQARYPDKFDASKAIDRDLDVERRILEELY